MELDHPSWLDATFLAAALQGGEDREPPVTVTKFTATPAVPPGENYLSRMYRVKVDYKVGEEEESTSLIVKAPFTKGIITEMEGNDFYAKEPAVYNQLLPIINTILNSEVAPKAHFSAEKNVLVLADLNKQGYKVCDRFKQLDFPHCEQVLKTLAKFHAGSVAWVKDNPQLLEVVAKEAFCNASDKFETEMKPWIQSSMKTVVGIVEEMNLGEDMKDLILSKVETAPDSIVRVCKRKETGLNVLNHGDLWVNNVLFKHNTSGEIVDVKLIDFQVMRYTMPAVDLLYFIWTSANEEVRECRLPELCEIYRHTLNSTLESLGCEERLTKDELREGFRDTIDWVIVTICNVLPIMVSASENVYNVEEVNEEDIKGGKQSETFMNLFKGKHFRALLPKLLRQYMAWISTHK